MKIAASSNTKKPKRVILLVLDSLGIGAMPDAKEFGDEGSHTLGHIAASVDKLQIPHLVEMGLGNISNMPGIPPAASPKACFGKCSEHAKGKDTTTGHWEMAGVNVTRPFPTYSDGFPEKFIQAFIERNQLPGVLGNYSASGTEIIQTLGDEHVKSGKPIVYTSADSVFQVACHEESFGLVRLLKICKNARELCDELGVARVIARPFLGANGNYKRTKNRKDFSIDLPVQTMMDHLQSHGVETTSIGKVASIYSEKGFNKKVPAGDNREIFAAVLAEMKQCYEGLIFGNLVDFDMLYGHRRNPKGYAQELEWFDKCLPDLQALMSPSDLLILTADHGNDPTFKGSDHTREFVPLLVWSKNTEENGGLNLGTRATFADIGQTILEVFGSGEKLALGTSFANLLN